MSQALNGDTLRQINADSGGTACADNAGGIGVGLAFDGTHLLLSCYSDSTITVVSPIDGSQIGHYGVIGGSALSAPHPSGKLGLNPEPAGAPDVPYADVGFRLAFTAPAAGPGERLKWALADQPYLALGPGGGK